MLWNIAFLIAAPLSKKSTLKPDEPEIFISEKARLSTGNPLKDC
jgi:hypothetical protein